MTLMPLVSTREARVPASLRTSDTSRSRDQWSAGRMWYSNTSPPTASSRMTTEIAIAQTWKKASEMASSAADPASAIGQ